MVEVRFNWHKPNSIPEGRVLDDGFTETERALVYLGSRNSIQHFVYNFKEPWDSAVVNRGIKAWAYSDEIMPHDNSNGNSSVVWFDAKNEQPQMDGRYVVIVKVYNHDEYYDYEEVYITHRKFFVTESKCVFEKVFTEDALYWTTKDCFLQDERLRKGLGL